MGGCVPARGAASMLTGAIICICMCRVPLPCVHMQSFWYFGVARAIHQLFADPAWRRLRSQGRRPSGTDSGSGSADSGSGSGSEAGADSGSGSDGASSGDDTDGTSSEAGSTGPEPCTYFSCADYQRLQGRVADMLESKIPEAQQHLHHLSHLNNSHYELGVDWFQPYQRKSHSIGVVVMR